MSRHAAKALAAVAGGLLLVLLLHAIGSPVENVSADAFVEQSENRERVVAVDSITQPQISRTSQRGSQKIIERHDPPSVTSPLFTAPCNQSATVDGYYVFAQQLMKRRLGAVLYSALYDEAMLAVLADAAANRTLGDTESWTWNIRNLRARPVVPAQFASSAQVLRLTKRLLSVGLGRMHRDVEMAKLYARTCSHSLAAVAFERAVVRVIEAHVNYMFTLLQLVLDSMENSARSALRHVHSTITAPVGEDALTYLMTKVTHESSIDDVQKLLDMSASELADLIKAQRAFLRTPTPSSPVHAMFPLDYGSDLYRRQGPQNGKFWNMIRPTASCTSLVRLCEKPDGCRLLCNAEYLLRAGLQERTASTTTDRYFHRIAGFGSNNEYDWETSLVNMFRLAQNSPAAVSHTIGWITVFDCTVGTRTNPWQPPKELTESRVGFGYGSLCLDAPQELSVDLSAPISIPDGANKFSLREMQYVLTSSEREAVQKSSPDSNVIKGRLVTRTSLHDSLLLRKTAPLSLHRTVVSSSGREPTVRLFDAITILKVDVEGYEFNVMPSWARDELRNIGQHIGRSDVSSLIDFEEAANDYFSVSLLSMEFHRSGHKYPYGAGLDGALRAHYTLLHIYSLGFIMAGQEKNHQDACCYELVWVHYRHFVKSEIWMLVGDGM